MVLKKEIIYPYFLECIELTNDNEWKIIFENLAYGIAPQGTFINKDYLYCRLKNKEFSYKIDRKSNKILFDEVKDILSKVYNSKNKKNVLNDIKLESNLKEVALSWKDIKKKNIKDLLFELYVIDMKKKYNLSDKVSKYLFSIICIALMLKSITNKDIFYENGKIVSINGITFENGNFKFDRNIYLNSDTICIDTIEDSKLMSDNWNKYIQALKNKMDKI
jgi:uncharacterized protein (UPF0297 family)